MATPMRSSSQEAGHRARVAADSRTTAKTDTQTSNFEYDDNEWDIGIGDLIIDLDADIEKTNEGAGAAAAAVAGVMATNATPQGSGKAAAKLAIEHSATVDKGLKMKIKRTKPGTKTSEAKHEIVKSNEQNGNVTTETGGTASGGGGAGSGGNSAGGIGAGSGNLVGSKHPTSATTQSTSVTPSSNNSTGSGGGGGGGNTTTGGGSGNSKRGSSGHRRDKTRDKHGAANSGGGGGNNNTNNSANNNTDKQTAKVNAQQSVQVTDVVNGLVRVSAPQTGPPRSIFPASTGPGPPNVPNSNSTSGPPQSPAAATAQGSAAKPEQSKVVSNVLQQTNDDNSTSPPPAKKLKTEPKDVSDVCVGTSVGTITEPDCLGPCEPGTSVTLEGIVWHETEGGVLVVNVTWRGKTYVGTLLDCTRHDWAPPRFCDSPTSDLDTRTPKGRGKRGRSAVSSTPSTDLSNFTETRSSVHSKLRNGGGVKGRRGAAANGSGASTAPSSPTPFVPPRPEPSNKRKSRAGEEQDNNTQTIQTGTNKKTKVVSATNQQSNNCNSPPPSPVLLECPEPNCSKKYKHINGLKYHQSHAHGSADDEDTKDITSMSENDESNIEAPSPATPIKSPEKSQDSPITPQKKDNELPLILRGSSLLEVPSQPVTPRSTPPSPATPQSIQDITTSVGSPTVPIVVDAKTSVVKPGVLRFTTTTTNEEFGVFTGNKTQQVSGPNLPNQPVVRGVNVSITTEQQIPQQQQQQQQTLETNQFANQLQTNQPFNNNPPPTLLIPTPGNQNQPQISPLPPQSPKPSAIQQPQFKVKPTAALMPDDKKQQDRNNLKPVTPNFKKKTRKSPAGSPDPPQTTEQPVFGIEQTGGRDEVQSPAYSDISDDGAPVLETDLTNDKNKTIIDKKTETGQQLTHMPQYGMYPYYGQPPYLVPTQQAPQQTQQPQQQSQHDNNNKNKEVDKTNEKTIEKEVKKENPNDYQQKVLQQHYYPYGYMPGYPYNVEPTFGTAVPIVPEDKMKEERLKDDVNQNEHPIKTNVPIPNPIQVPTPGKVKTESNLKEKHQNENHQILKESIEIKNQMSPYLYSSRQQSQQQSQQQVQQQQQQHNQRDEEVRRFYAYDQRRKDVTTLDHKNSTSNKVTAQSPQQMKQQKEKEDKKEKQDIKQEGVKPTMETQGPPPPPTSQYAYIHPSYIQSPHYGTLPFDPNHPMYRGIMVPGPYSGNPYLHPQIPRYHAPEDLSRAPPPTKALDMLQHHAQYYSSHKIHELQERAIKSPTPKTSVASASPSANSACGGGGVSNNVPTPNQNSGGGGGGGGGVGGPPTSQSNSAVQQSGGKQTTGDNKESRSPPPQRHVHTHHHTHVGLGYPMYHPAAPFGAAVLASQQAAAVTVINPYPPK